MRAGSPGVHARPSGRQLTGISRISLARVHDFAISLDGFGTGEGQTLAAPSGHAGERLHECSPLLGRGTRVWDGLEGVDRDYRVETTPSPSGVTHMTFTRTVS